MNRKMHKPAFLIALLALATGCLVFPTPANAKWHDRSDELPGTVSITPYVITGAAVVATLTAVLIYKHGKKSSTEKDEKANDTSLRATVPANGPDLAWTDLPALEEIRTDSVTPTTGTVTLLRMRENARTLGLAF